MGWKLHIADFEDRKQIGAVWSYPSQPDRVFITLPCGSAFPADGHHETADPWRVTGELPNISMQPSIRVHGGWHGFITDGVLSDDLEHKVFPQGV